MIKIRFNLHWFFNNIKAIREFSGQEQKESHSQTFYVRPQNKQIKQILSIILEILNMLMIKYREIYEF